MAAEKVKLVSAAGVEVEVEKEKAERLAGYGFTPVKTSSKASSKKSD